MSRTLLAEIGGTYSRFAVSEDGATFLCDPQKIRNTDFETFESALSAFLELENIPPGAVSALFVGRSGRNTWSVDAESAEKIFPGARVRFFADIEATAAGLINPSPDDLFPLADDANHPVSGKTKAVISVGTGVGLAYITAEGSVLKTRGGHMLPALLGQEQADIYQALHAYKKRDDTAPVYEDALAGDGLLNVYKILAARHHLDCEYYDVNDVIARGRNDPLVQQALRFFHEIAGQFIHQAVAFGGAYGGVYLTGGIIDRLVGESLLKREILRDSFRQPIIRTVRDDAAATPLFWVKDEFTALRGLLKLSSIPVR